LPELLANIAYYAVDEKTCGMYKADAVIVDLHRLEPFSFRWPR
jgi:hypothetical protein